MITTKIPGSSTMFIFIYSRYCHCSPKSLKQFPTSPEYVRAPIYPHPQMLIIVIISVCVYVQSLSHVPLFATPWTIAHQTLLSTEILQARILEWVAMPSSRGSSQPRGRTCVSYIFCMGRRVLYPLCHLGSSAVFFRERHFPGSLAFCFPERDS